MACKVELRAKDFVTGTPVATAVAREVLIGPKVTRRLMLGDVNDAPDKSCADGELQGRAEARRRTRRRASVAPSCRAASTRSSSIRSPPSGSGIEGRYRGALLGPHGSAVHPPTPKSRAPAVTPALDAAAIATMRSGKFTSDCDYGLGSIRIAFKLQD